MSERTGERVALILGVGGLGGAISARLAADGYALALGDARQDTVSTVAGEVAGHGGKVSSTAIDVTDEDALQALVEGTVRAHGRLDALVYCVGISPRTNGRAPRLTEITRAEWDRVLAVNLGGAFLASQAAAPALAASRGSIVHISSGLGRGPSGANTSGLHYIASKAGLIGLTKALAMELAPAGVRVNSVAPGWVATPLTSNQAPEVVAAAASAVPLDRTARPEDIAAAVAFLLSLDAAFITGATLDVNGGRLMI